MVSLRGKWRKITSEGSSQKSSFKRIQVKSWGGWSYSPPLITTRVGVVCGTKLKFSNYLLNKGVVPALESQMEALFFLIPSYEGHLEKCASLEASLNPHMWMTWPQRSGKPRRK